MRLNIGKKIVGAWIYSKRLEVRTILYMRNVHQRPKSDISIVAFLLT